MNNSPPANTAFAYPPPNDNTPPKPSTSSGTAGYQSPAEAAAPSHGIAQVSSAQTYNSQFMPGDPGGFVVPMNLAISSGVPMGIPPPQMFAPQYPYRAEGFGVRMPVSPALTAASSCYPQQASPAGSVQPAHTAGSSQSPPPYTSSSPQIPPTPAPSASTVSCSHQRVGAAQAERQSSVSSQYSSFSYHPMASDSLSVESFNPFAESNPSMVDAQQGREAFKWSEVRWAPVEGGVIPRSALVAGTNNGERVYVGRGVDRRGQMRVGMLTQKLSGCLIEQGGVPALIKSYQLLCVPPRNAVWTEVRAPFNRRAFSLTAISSGTDAGGRAVYVARKRKDGGNVFVADAVEDSEAGISFIYYGRKRQSKNFEILCIDPDGGR